MRIEVVKQFEPRPVRPDLKSPFALRRLSARQVHLAGNRRYALGFIAESLGQSRLGVTCSTTRPCSALAAASNAVPISSSA
jgi:hypothetical protein